MQWIYELLKIDFNGLDEPKVDCQSCRVDSSLARTDQYSEQTKCCDFTPLWSAFAVGAWLKQNPNWQPPQSGLLTVFGLMHELAMRNTKSLCHYFDKAEGRCGIWQQRPATCYSFYCASQYSRGLEVYAQLEQQLLLSEAQLLKKHFDDRGGLALDWQTWCDYMEQTTTLTKLPESLLLPDWSMARLFYSQSYDWLLDHKESPECHAMRESLHLHLENITEL